MVTSDAPIDESNFADAKPLSGAPSRPRPGPSRSFDVPKGSQGYVAIRAVDEQGNVGRVASVKAKASAGGGSCAQPDRRDERRRQPPRDVRRRRHPRQGGSDRIDGRGGDDCIKGGKARTS